MILIYTGYYSLHFNIYENWGEKIHKLFIFKIDVHIHIKLLSKKCIK